MSAYAGQAVALVLADTHAHALKMAAAITVTYDPIAKPILSIQEAIEKQSFHSSNALSNGVVTIGDTQGNWFPLYTL